MSPEAPNPYSAPVQAYVPDRSAMSTSTRSWHMFYCVGAIVLGILGLAGGIMGLGGVIVNRFVPMNAVQAPPSQGVSQEFLDIQEEMNAEVKALEGRYLVFLVVVQVLLVAAAGLLTFSGVRALQQTKSAATMLGYVFLAVSVFDVLRLILTVIYQMEVSSIMNKHFGPLMESAGPENAQLPPGFSNMMTTAMSVAFGIGICMLVGWVLIKLAFYLSGWLFLNRPQVQAVLKD